MRDEKLAAALGWASLGLGVPQTLAPKRFAEAIGAKADDRTVAITRYACGLRELQAAAGILKVSDPPTMWLWSRVAGDLLDLTLLGSALANKPKDPRRLTYAAVAVAGIMVADAYAAGALTRKRKGKPPVEQETEAEQADMPRDRIATTIRHERAGVERQWAEHTAEEAPDWLEHATVTFAEAPGDRGTEIHVHLHPPGGITAALGRFATAPLDTRAKDFLRRFKQIVETGEVVRAEGTPEGGSVLRNLKQRPAQPMNEAQTEATTR